ncbi:MAG TPA: hypothetical protein VHE78_13365 [Gemmatimonadaceae bacterium]|nr:hypothetical protein [Gemmatimonadaceae bacterium]
MSGVFMVHLGYTSPGFVRAFTAHEVGHFYWGQYVLDREPGVLGALMLGNSIWDDQLYIAQHRGIPLSEQWLTPDIFNPRRTARLA